MSANLVIVAAAVLLSGAAFGASVGPGAAAKAADFFVATNGSDKWSGRAAEPNEQGTDGPFATLGRARDAVRATRGSRLRRDVTVLIRGGSYRLGGPVVFGPDDGGTATHSITYAAYPGETPVFSGGEPIAGWVKAGRLWQVRLPEVRAGKWYFYELFVNGWRARRARAPNRGFFRVVRPGQDGRTSFAFKPGELRAWPDLTDAEIVFLHDWSISRVRLRGVDEKAGIATLADPIGSGLDFFRISGFEPHPRYIVENARELLDEPGEWHLDRKSGVLAYWPLPGEEPAKAEVIAPRIERLVEVKGEPSAGRFVRNLRFAGLSFAHCAWPRPAHGYAAGQAGFHDIRTDAKSRRMRGRMPAALEFTAARGCAFDDGRIEHVGGCGISLGEHCRDNQIVGNVIADVAGNGVMVGGPGRDAGAVARNNLVANNTIHRCGREFYGCVGVWAGITDGTIVRRNEIAHLPYTGVSVGWCWSTETTACRKNLIESNHIHHVMQTLSDGGGIYTLGRQPGSVLRGNVIHDVPPNAGRAESNGMFIDEGSSLILIEGNTIYNVARSSIRFHKAEKNVLRENVLVTPGAAKPFMFNACREDSMTYERNVILDSGSFKPPVPARLKAGPEPKYRKRLPGAG